MDMASYKYGHPMTKFWPIFLSMGGPRHVGSGVHDGPINHIAIEPFELHHQILIKNLSFGHSKVCDSIVGTINST